MPTVFIPSPMRSLTGDQQTVEVEGSTVRQVFDALDQAYPGFKQRLVEDGQIKPNIAIAVDGEVTPLGMLEQVGTESEVHILSAISGG